MQRRRDRRLGHSSSVITLGYYAHFMPEAGSEGRGAIEGLLGERGAGSGETGAPVGTPRVLPGAVDRRLQHPRPDEAVRGSQG